MTQACDLEQEKVRNVVTCPHLSLSDYKATWEAFLRQRNQNPTAKAWRTHCDDIKDGYAWNLSILNRSSVPVTSSSTASWTSTRCSLCLVSSWNRCSRFGAETGHGFYRRTANICPKRSPVFLCVWGFQCRSTSRGRGWSIGLELSERLPPVSCSVHLPRVVRPSG